ncbi:hypothetical protein [Phenylobacterium aquaticum]|uniref:hypothetical protein n=1 Tax=Phenylobacterium aquaticum TaxID=1763816 RepID=UPI001F5D7424|nr:hypothetical protein [Phenylobacterium aquaticum]MCI3132435.1 hypothetical protein [Phenylobacterium aquaticum]
MASSQTPRSAPPARRSPRILISEGSSLSARETVTALGLAGHRVEILSSDPLCLARFSRFTDQVHPAPAAGHDPEGYLTAVLEVVARRRIEVLLPTHEQAYLLAAARPRLPAGLGIALADVAAFEQVQGKVALAGLLSRLAVPHPDTEVLRSAEAFAAPRPLPFFAKTDCGTASTAVWRVADAAAQARLAGELEAAGAFDQGVVAQGCVSGPLERLQAVFDRGRLVAHHAYRQLAEGPGGGDVLKISVRRPAARDHVARIGAALAWHGALSFDYVLDAVSGEPRFIDANPRLVEPMNAWLSGVDLAGALLDVSLGLAAPAQAEGREGVVTRLGLMALMQAARRGGRAEVFATLIAMTAGVGRFRGSVEELVPLTRDPGCALPLARVLAELLASPAKAETLPARTIDAYSLTPAAIAMIRGWTRTDG